MSAQPDEVLMELPRAGGEVLRVMLREFRGHPYVDVRNWYGDASGIKPGKGCTVRPAELAEVIEALQVAASFLPGVKS